MEVDKSIFNYFGSKKSIADWIINNFPSEYSRYVEVCSGTAYVLLREPKSEVEDMNDIKCSLLICSKL